MYIHVLFNFALYSRLVVKKISKTVYHGMKDVTDKMADYSPARASISPTRHIKAFSLSR